MLSFGENNGTGASIFTLRSSVFLASMVFRSLGWAYYVGVVNSSLTSNTESCHDKYHASSDFLRITIVQAKKSNTH